MDIVGNITRLFYQGGWVIMLSITATLVVSLVIIIERSLRYWLTFDLPNSSEFAKEVERLVYNNSIEHAIRYCKKKRPALVPYVLAEGLKHANDSTEEIANAMDHATYAAVPNVTTRLPLLATTANVATLLGLLGTIFGLMKSFAAAARATGSEKQALLAEGIAEALTATSYGLGTALLCLFAYGVLSMKQTSIVDDINKHTSRLVGVLYSRRVRLKSSSATPRA